MVKFRAVYALVVAAAVVAGLVGFFAGSTQVARPGPPVTVTVVRTVTTPIPISIPEKVRAAWIYVGPIGDLGWSYMHDLGRRVVENLFKQWLETTYYESVREAELLSRIDELVRAGYTVIFTTSFDFMDKTYEASLKYPNVLFFHCSGYKRWDNMGTYFADLYQIYYLNGLMAGALTKSGKIGYVAAFTIPEVIRHINAFAIGAREVGEQLGKSVEVYVVEIGAWFAPDKAVDAARYLVDVFGVDVIAFTEDSSAIVEFAQELHRKGKAVYVFGHYAPMYEYGPDAVVSGQLVRWEVIYADILVKIRSGVLNAANLRHVDYWYLLNTGAVELGAHVFENGTVMMVNPKYVPELKNVVVRDKLTGERVSVYDLVMRRYEQMKSAPLLQSLQFSAITHELENTTYVGIGGREKRYLVSTIFDPFVGPLEGWCRYTGDKAFTEYCRKSDRVSIPTGLRLGHADLWNMDWFVSWVKYLGVR
ncbi:MAG: BMP family ABC transporter substrate-binding protein [Sulfolobales archaeon]|nr:BMP family ABC transporter substrate-binding protein [Sulfolobales archaeon]